MKITLHKPFEPGYKVGMDFVNKCGNYLLLNCNDLLSGYFKSSSDLSATALKGGHNSVVYKIEDVVSKNRVVVKFPLTKTLFWQEISGYKIAKNCGIETPKVHSTIENETEDTYAIILEYLDLPLLTKSEKPQHFKELGRQISWLHSVEVEGFGEFAHGTNKGVSNDPKYLINKFMDEESARYLVDKGLITNQQMDKIQSKVSEYKYEDRARVIHGDIRNENIFYDHGRLIMFDFWTAASDPLLDIAIYSYRSQAEELPMAIENFSKGYSKTIDEEKLAHLIGLISIRKASKNHYLGRQKKLTWNIEYLNKYI